MNYDYRLLKVGKRLSHDEYERVFLNEMNLAIRACDGYAEGMKVVDVGGGYGLAIDGKNVPESNAEFILLRASRLLYGGAK